MLTTLSMCIAAEVSLGLSKQPEESHVLNHLMGLCNACAVQCKLVRLGVQVLAEGWQDIHEMVRQCRQSIIAWPMAELPTCCGEMMTWLLGPSAMHDAQHHGRTSQCPQPADQYARDQYQALMKLGWAPFLSAPCQRNACNGRVHTSPR